MENIQTLIHDMCQWNRIVAGDRDTMARAYDASESEEHIAALNKVYEFSYETLKEIEIKAIKMGLLGRTQGYCYVSESEMGGAQ